jgi:hypothetical protein
MDKTNKPNMRPQIPEPTEKEIKETIKKIKIKHGVILPHTGAKKFAKLTNELKWWLEVEKAAEKPEAINNKIVESLLDDPKRLKTGKDLKKSAEISLKYAIVVEKKRILQEMKRFFKD